MFLLHLYKNGERGTVVSVPNNLDFCVSNQKLEDCPHSLHQAEEQRLSRQFPDVNGEELHGVRGGKFPEPRHTDGRVVYFFGLSFSQKMKTDLFSYEKNLSPTGNLQKKKFYFQSVYQTIIFYPVD